MGEVVRGGYGCGGVRGGIGGGGGEGEEGGDWFDGEVRVMFLNKEIVDLRGLGKYVGGFWRIGRC